ncbi:hypothetical protein MHH62_14165 [Pseudomonas sp. FSL L8-0168]|uniref:hypothetical protein n=1 Tax=Pseudomonas sp. FSL L8-0168 TaxID=2921518 RepID=UPI0030DC4840
MATDREIQLEQALVAAFGAAEALGLDHYKLYEKSQELILDNSKYRHVGHPHVTKVCNELQSAYEQFKTAEGE